MSAACHARRPIGLGLSSALISPMPGWITVAGAAGDPIEVEVTDLTGGGCRVRCRMLLRERSLVDFQLGGSLFAQASVGWWRDGWADLRFTEPLGAARIEPLFRADRGPADPIGAGWGGTGRIAARGK